MFSLQESVALILDVRISMVTLIEKRMALEMGQFSGFSSFTKHKSHILPKRIGYIFIAACSSHAAMLV